MKRSSIYTALCLGFLVSSFGWTPAQLRLEWVPTYGDAELVLGAVYGWGGTDSVEITQLRMYVTQVEGWNNGKQVWKEENSYHLLDWGAGKTGFEVEGEQGKWNELRFSIGVDSLTNVSGAFGGDLDPTSGMYWTWQSGYINFKLEGRATHCPGRKQRFQYHLGGYAAPNATLQRVQVPVQNTDRIQLELAVDAFLKAMDPAELYEIMAPGSNAQMAAALFPDLIQLRP